MIRARITRFLLGATALALALAAPASVGAAIPVSAWDIQSLATPTNFAPGDESGKAGYDVFITNNGGEVSDESEITITDTLPAGLTVKGVELFGPRRSSTDLGKAPACETSVVGEVSTVSCKVTNALLAETSPAKLYPGNELQLQVKVAIPPSATGTLVNRVEVEGGGAAAVSAEAENPVSAEPAAAGFQEFRAQLSGPDGLPSRAAASHPYQYTTSFVTNMVPAPAGSSFPFVPAEGDLKEVEVALPPGLAGNPTAVTRCGAQAFNTVRSVFVPEEQGNVRPNECPAGSAVGLAIVQQLEGAAGIRKFPIYNLIPPPGMPAQFGFQVLGAPIYINTRLRSEGDYGITAYLKRVPEAQRVTATRVTIWGAPWEASHDPVRGECAETNAMCPVEGSARALLRLPSFCGAPLLSRMIYTTWARPVTGASAQFAEAAPTECDKPPFEPSIEARPTSGAADSPAGLRFGLHLPQAAHEAPEALGEADLREARVVLPEGLVANPAQADGLGACSPAEVGLATAPGQAPIHFDAAPARCPDAAKIGTVAAEVPALDHTLEGAVYLATQEANPFNSLLALYIVLEDPQTGIVVKLAAEVSPDPVTGRLTTTVRESPQVPFEDFRFDFFAGARAPLRTPPTCGTHTTNTEMTPWSAPAGARAFPSDSFQTSAPAPGQASCPTAAAGLPNAPSFEAGTEAPIAGATSPLVVNLSRADGSQEFGQVTLDPPPGLLASLAGIPYCSDAALAAAAARSGKDELADPSCPASRVGGLTVGAGAGPTPYHAPGAAYLAGPYKGAPLSLATIVPAVAGPFDLGTVVVRVALHVDPVTTQITAASDPIPHILQGIPLDVRSVSVRLDRPGWGLNPTSCAEKAFDGALRSTLGQVAPLHNRFQVGECARLAFKPRLGLRLKGKTRRGAFPALRAVYRPRAGNANLNEMVLRFPRSEFIEQGHFRTICTRVQWAAGAGGGSACPKGSIYGRIAATTPLLDEPLRGPVYLRSSDHNLPDVVFALRGQVSAEVSVRIDSRKGGLRASIDSAPDVPISKVVLDMRGGGKGLFVNSRDICAHRYRAAVRLGAQNGKGKTLKPPMRAKCKKQKAKKRRKGHRRKGHANKQRGRR